MSFVDGITAVALLAVCGYLLFSMIFGCKADDKDHEK